MKVTIILDKKTILDEELDAYVFQGVKNNMGHTSINGRADNVLSCINELAKDGTEIIRTGKLSTSDDARKSKVRSIFEALLKGE